LDHGLEGVEQFRAMPRILIISIENLDNRLSKPCPRAVVDVLLQPDVISGFAETMADPVMLGLAVQHILDGGSREKGLAVDHAHLSRLDTSV
jgi:hypothetical protein